jgi:hypothetical protein
MLQVGLFLPNYLNFIFQLQLNISSDKYELYDGASSNEVLAEYEQHRSSWAINLFSWKQKTIKLNPFNQSCVGIHSSEGYEVHLNIISKFPLISQVLTNWLLISYSMIPGLSSSVGPNVKAEWLALFCIQVALC